ncbi:hypothetical protein F4823DRAFT_561650 [Ustulina deusta]|nr:hypothetical protein F4823DRAFT_561650 [Ustulina deusta]
MTTYNNSIDYFKATAGYFGILKPVESGNNGYRKAYSIVGSTAVPKQWQIDEESLLISPELTQQFNKPLGCVCDPLGYMGEICNEGGLESFYYQIIILPLARALEGIDSDIRIYARLPISGQPLNKDSTQATTNFTPDGTVCGRDRQPYLVFDYKYAYQTTPLDPVDGASPLNNSYVGHMISYCVSGNISDAMILKEDALIFLHIIGPPNNESTLTELSDALSDVDPLAPLQDAKRPWTAGSRTSSNLPQRKRTAFDPRESPDPIANSSPNQATNRGAIIMATRTRNPRIDSVRDQGHQWVEATHVGLYSRT